METFSSGISQELTCGYWEKGVKAVTVGEFLLLQLTGPLPSASRVPEVKVLCGTPGTAEMFNIKWLMQFCAESDLISQIQAKAADMNSRNIYRQKP